MKISETEKVWYDENYEKGVRARRRIIAFLKGNYPLTSSKECAILIISD